MYLLPNFYVAFIIWRVFLCMSSPLLFPIGWLTKFLLLLVEGWCQVVLSSEKAAKGALSCRLLQNFKNQ